MRDAVNTVQTMLRCGLVDYVTRSAGNRFRDSANGLRSLALIRGAPPDLTCEVFDTSRCVAAVAAFLREG